MIIAVGLLHFMKESAVVYVTNDPTRQYRLLKLMALPYRFGPNRFAGGVESLSRPASQDTQAKNAATSSTTTVAPISSSDSDFSLRQPPYGARGGQGQVMTTTTTIRTNTFITYGQDCVTVRITMHSDFGFRSWRCFEAIIESLAVGIYLYATFVLTSSLFLNADKAIVYAVVMTVCLSGIRILSTLF